MNNVESGQNFVNISTKVKVRALLGCKKDYGTAKAIQKQQFMGN
jgi:hypothetical protein